MKYVFKKNANKMKTVKTYCSAGIGKLTIEPVFEFLVIWCSRIDPQFN